jgi:mRNA turnover protein 4
MHTFRCCILLTLATFAQHLEGNTGLLYTSRSREEVERYFAEFSVPEFAKAGTVPDQSITLDAGPLPFPISMMQELRKMGLVVEVEAGGLQLRDAATIASAGSPLTPEQAKILTKLDMKLIDFKIKLLCRWEDGAYQEY